MSWFDGRERWVFALLSYALLAASSAAAALTDPPATATTAWLDLPWPVPALAVAVWLAPLVWLHPRRDTHRVLVVAHYGVLIALAGALITASTSFLLFASVGYPLAIGLLPGRLVMLGVTLTAVVGLAAQAGPEARATLLSVTAGVAIPLVVAGWYVAAEHDKRRRLVERLRSAMANNADLNARLLEQARHAGVLAERHRMAGELHDTLAQDLAALIGRLDAAARASEGPARRRHLDQAAALARHSLSEARRSVRALRPEPLEHTDLPRALERLATSWSSSAGVRLTLEITGTPVALAADVEIALFRVAQEALTNVAKHARAARAGLTLSYTDELILLDIRDDGAGFAPHAPADGFGLDSMRRRLSGIGGTLYIESEPGHGTAIAATAPTLPPAGLPGTPAGEKA